MQFEEIYVKQLPKNCEECVFAQEEEYGIITTCKLLDIIGYWPGCGGQLDNETFDGWCSFNSRYPKCPLKELK